MIVLRTLMISLCFCCLGFVTPSLAAKNAIEFTVDSQQHPPTVSNTELLVWANEAIISVYSYDFANYRKQLQQAASYFTPEGWKAYLEAFTESGVMDVVKKERYTVSAVATAPPIIVEQGLVDQQYTWKVDMPVLVLYQSANESADQQQYLRVELLIVATRADTVGTRGLGIIQFSASRENPLS